MSCVPTATALVILQSIDMIAPPSAGAVPSHESHSPCAKRSAIGTLPENAADNPCWSTLSVLMQTAPFAMVAAYADEPRLIHTSTLGGASVTLHTAEAVKPARPPGP